MSLLSVLDRIADVSSMDRVVSPVQRAVNAVLRPQALKDALHGTWLGHPVHPVLAQVPVGTWLSAGVLDLLPTTRRAATALIATGVAASVPTAMAGAADWSEQDPGVRRLGLLHAGMNVVALGLYVGSLRARRRGAGGLGLVLSYAGLTLAGGSAAIGGHMSYAQSSGASHSVTAARTLGHDWIDLGPMDDLPEGRPALRTGDAAGSPVPLVVVRRGGRVSVFLGACSHLGGPLFEGRVEQVGGRDCLVCPWHESAFDLDGGDAVRGPAGVPQEPLEVRTEAGHVLARLAGRHREG
ncbi:Rieske 2Fe-2S domain-containing protein [Modestobacter sp. I12A-02628]|uniref:Rieske 2Fe-2S domain-containing protein n=1 Tax=Goekera deserti TaxID=2497753 RepID=A0A7K3W918_9ACTN|nr:Rieske (2Fe-2S) protein [Goekera deserti]MPQ98665.1 Rieske 2Fe-2S domain-containing protein [Goekera deserti]NDI49227.1 Rieske 2Fe-2S domain-containing protein [Goekera deserti]NEL52965.1 Rieske 2Fe-2S domain-containing protein [Goekera deserti]